MDWFERLTGFREAGYEETRARLVLEDRRLRSTVNGRAWDVGELELPSLQELRERVRREAGPAGRLRVGVEIGDVRRMHRAPAFGGALFQVASQFNLLEMVSPEVSPEQGVGRYEHDPTQGPACAIAAGAATIHRNYFAPVEGVPGQTAARQLDALADLGRALGEALGRPPAALWTMRNGYALCTREGLDAIAAHLAALDPQAVDRLRGRLRIGVHRDVEVTDGGEAAAVATPRVSQAFCSALPVAYSRVPAARWQAFATLVLEAAYEATLWAGVLNARRGASNVVLLTRLGGGAFGNDEDWIDAALRRALRLAAGFALDVRLVSYGTPSPRLRALVEPFA